MNTAFRLSRCAQALLLAGVLMGLGSAQAGQSCEQRALTPEAVARGLTLAQHTAEVLEARHQQHGTRVVLVARAGQDLRRWDQHWSHVGWAYRNPEGLWRVVHKLNQCGTRHAVLMRQGLGEFLLDDPWRMEIVFSAASPGVQDALWPLLQDAAQLRLLHERRYNMLSYPWATRYQQSNQWAIETLALAVEPGIRRRDQAQAWLRLKDYRPPTLRIGAMTRLGARATRANVTFDDHPPELRFADQIQTVTADSVLDWLPRALQFEPGVTLTPASAQRANGGMQIQAAPGSGA